MALDAYRKKRDFATTPEPRGGDPAAGETEARFVVQKHDATRLHYDFRLEMDGVLKSWAVTRGPSLETDEKRLAVHVEDHPLEYGDFEGNIPEGEYGAGPVLVWDRGTWSPIGDARKGYAKGHLEFELRGEKLRGRWHLVRMQAKEVAERRKSGGTRENWLLIKADDDDARPEGSADILDERPESVKTGRTIAEIALRPAGASKTSRAPRRRKTTRRHAQPGRDALSVTEAHGGGSAGAFDPAMVDGAKKGPLPGFVEPMLASLVSAAPAGEDWLHEIKFDGYRLQARIDEGDRDSAGEKGPGAVRTVRLSTRTGLDWTTKFGERIVRAFETLPVRRAILDGELVVETDAGASDFSALQADLKAGRRDRFVFWAFDLLHLDGWDLRAAPLVERKRLLERIVSAERPAGGGPIRFSRHLEERGALVLRHACRLSLEGIVSKRRDAAYRTGRTKAWVKSKCSARQEFVVAGWVPSSVSRKAVGSLVLGVWEAGALRHVGRVGTGFTDAVAADLARELEPLGQSASPFTEPMSAEEARGVRFVRPELVAEVEFRAWTADGHLRHASFRGLREDKPAREVVREHPRVARPSHDGEAARPTDDAGAGEEHPGRRRGGQRRRVPLTHPDRLYWPEDGVTKEGLADYYTEIWHHIAPWIVGRPLSLLRCPTGIGGAHFFQKHAWKGLQRRISLPTDPKDPPGEPLIAIEDLDGLLGLVQAAVLEIHPWGSSLADWEHPDIIVIDLDPGEGVAWPAVIEAAEEVRDRLDEAGLAAFVKTSGGKGLHVVSPLRPRAAWPAVKAFTKGLADAMAADSPDRYVATVAKAKRRGRILIDYLRNQRGATAVAAYSTRARPGAAVSAPLAWDELTPAVGPAYFTLPTMPKRLAALSGDPWAGFRAAAKPLEADAPRARKAVRSPRASRGPAPA